MSNSPEIKEVERLQYKPGDRFVLHCEGFLTQEQARTCINRFRATLNLPGDTPVAIIDQSWTLVIVSPDEDLGDADVSE